MRNQLSSYQIKGIKSLVSNNHFALLWSMRLRKSIVLIRFIRLYQLYPVLISAPFSAIYEWKDQLINDGVKDSHIVIISDKPSKRFRQDQLRKIDHSEYIFIMNHDCYKSVPEIGNMFFECMIFDEAHNLKNPKSKMSQFYIRNFRSVNHRIVLTGTWISESELDLFQIFKFLDYSYVFPYDNYWQCRHALFTNEHFEWIMKPQGKKYFSNLLVNYAHTLEYADAGVEDKVVEIYRYVELKSNVREYYETLLNKFILEDEWVQKSTIFAAVNYTWMRQLLSGFIEDRLLNKSKLDELDLLLNTEFKNKKVIIWCYFKEECKSIAKYLNCYYLTGDIKLKDREYLKNSFNHGRLNRLVIIARKGVATEGTNLSSADAQIYMTVPESQIILNQSKRRLFDIDQEQLKPCIYLVTKDTIDEIIIDSHKKKTNCRKVIYEYAKRISKKCING